MNSPTTGTTKNPTTPSPTPAPVVEGGTPVDLSRRPGTVYLTTLPTTSIRVATANTTHPVVVPTTRAQTSRAPRIRTVPGRIGTRIPTNPVRIASATRTSVTDTAATLSQALPRQWIGTYDGPRPPSGGGGSRGARGGAAQPWVGEPEARASRWVSSITLAATALRAFSCSR